jgi:hypothetical protein
MSTTRRPPRSRTRLLIVAALATTLFSGILASPASASGRPAQSKAYYDTGTDTNSFQCLNADCTERGDFGTSVGSGHGRHIGRFTSLGGTYVLANGDVLESNFFGFVEPDDVTCADGHTAVKQFGQFAGGTGRFEHATGDFTFRACVTVTDVSDTGRVTYVLSWVRQGTIQY